MKRKQVKVPTMFLGLEGSLAAILLLGGHNIWADTEKELSLHSNQESRKPEPFLS